MKRFLAIAAIVVAAVVLLSGFGAILAEAPAHPAAASATPLSSLVLKTLESSPAPALPSVLPDTSSAAGLAAIVASYAGLSPAQSAAVVSWLSSLTTAQAEQLLADGRAHVAPTPAVLAAVGLTPADDNPYCLGASVIAGAGIGALGGPFGALLGAIAGAVVGYYACQEQVVSNDVGAAYRAWAEASMGGYGNQVNLTAGEFQSIASALNVSTVGWERAADHAALFQLGNKTFNVGQDLLQSQTYQNLAPVSSAYAFEATGEFASIVTAVNGHGGSNGAYGPLLPGVSVGAGGNVCSIFCLAVSPYDSVMGYGAQIPTGAGAANVFIPQAANITAECTSSSCPATVDLYNELSHVWYNLSSSYSGSCVPGFETDFCNVGVFPGPSGLYAIPEDGTLQDLYVPGGQLTPTSATSGIPVTGWINDNGTVQGAAPIGTGGAFGVGVTIYCSGGSVSGGCPNSGIKGASTYNYAPTPGPTWAGLGSWVTTIEWQAAMNAEAYWDFLRADGFTAASQVPVDCLVPEPYLVLPSSINGADLNASEWESLYLAALEGMGHFYNVTLNATSFCGTQAVKQWSFGGSIWGNLYVNASGFVYATNGSVPVDYNGKPMPSEKFNNVSTWAIGSTFYSSHWYNGSEQLYLMPTLATARIPVGVRYEVPADNPIEVYAVQTGLFLSLTGNGTANGTIPAGHLTAGDAIYLTSCSVHGNATKECGVTVQTVNVTLVNITCNGPCYANQTTTSTFGGFPDPFSWLGNLLSGLFGGGPLGSLLGSLFAALIYLAIIVVGIYVAVVEFRSWGQRKREASGKSDLHLYEKRD
jgi:hypothetical protein